MSAFPGGREAEDRRQEVVAMAARTERANQPRHLIFLAGALVVVAVVYLLVGWRAQASAMASLRDEQKSAQTVQAALGTLRGLQAAGSNTGPKANESSDTILSRIQKAGTDAGLKNPVPLPAPGAGRPTRTNSNKDVAKATWRYTIQDPSLGALWEFLRHATEAVGGLEVYSVSMKPVGQQWEMTVEFCRWERVEGS